jgi:transposase
LVQWEFSAGSDMTSHPRDLISDTDWEQIWPHFPKRTRPANGRLFLEAVMFRARTGIPWRDLPKRFGPWTTQFNRFSHWSARGFFETLSRAVRAELGHKLREASLDSTSVKLHAGAHGLHPNRGSKKVSPKVGRAVAGPRKSMPSPMKTVA